MLLSAQVALLRAFRTRNLHLKQHFDVLFSDLNSPIFPYFGQVCWRIAVFGIGG
jgi:hypothetical protein